MKKRLNHLLSGLLIGLPLLITPIAIAHEGEVHATSTDNTQTSETDKKERSERLTKFKAQFKVSLTEAQKAVLKGKCVGAQRAVASLNDKFGNSVTRRTKAYTALQERLDKLVTKLKAESVDTATLEQQIAELKTKITNYNTDLTAYKQSLTDLKEVDCKTDPDAFKAALEAARSNHAKIVADVSGTRTYLKDTIKPTLQAILEDLKETEQTTNNTTN